MSTNQTYPGAIPMTNEEYHADVKRISNSGLSLIARSPLHYWAKYLDPNRPAEEPKKHFIIGSATHAAVLEPNYLERRYFVLDDRKKVAEIGGANPRNTNKYREWKAEQLALNAGKQELMIDEWDKIRYMRDAIFAHPAARAVLSAGLVEQTFHYTCPITGAPVKFRPDFINVQVPWLVDLKTTDDARPAAFGKSFFNWGYHRQSGIYLDGIEAVTGQTFDGMAFIAVEKERPFAVQVYYPTADDLEIGRAENYNLLETYLNCVRTNTWPAYGYEPQPIQRPGWIKSIN